jgi:hypothetical protein
VPGALEPPANAPVTPTPSPAGPGPGPGPTTPAAPR